MFEPGSLSLYKNLS